MERTRKKEPFLLFLDAISSRNQICFDKFRLCNRTEVIIIIIAHGNKKRNDFFFFVFWRLYSDALRDKVICGKESIYKKICCCFDVDHVVVVVVVVVHKQTMK